MTFSTQKMLDNAATASQSKHLLDEPKTRGAVLRSIHQWIGARVNENPFATPMQLMNELKADKEYDL